MRSEKSKKIKTSGVKKFSNHEIFKSRDSRTFIQLFDPNFKFWGDCFAKHSRFLQGEKANISLVTVGGRNGHVTRYPTFKNQSLDLVVIIAIVKNRVQSGLAVRTS